MINNIKTLIQSSHSACNVKSQEQLSVTVVDQNVLDLAARSPRTESGQLKSPRPQSEHSAAEAPSRGGAS